MVAVGSPASPAPLPGGLHVGWRIRARPRLPGAPSPTVERQALANLLALYQEAVGGAGKTTIGCRPCSPGDGAGTGPAYGRLRTAPGPVGGLCEPGGLPGDPTGRLSADHGHRPGHPARDGGHCPGPEQRHVPGSRKHARSADGWRSTRGIAPPGGSATRARVWCAWGLARSAALAPWSRL